MFNLSEFFSNNKFKKFVELRLKKKKMMSLEKRAIQRYERENKEQLDTIEKIVTVLNQPELFKLLTFRMNNFTDSQRNQYFNESLNKRNELQHEENMKRILELEAELEQKKINYQTREKQVSEYLENQKKFEELLEKNEREKVELLNQLQNSSSSMNLNMNRSLTLEDLEDKVAAKKHEYEKLKLENSQTKEKCEKLKDQLQNSYNYSKVLKQQLTETRNLYTTESPMVKFRNNEETIESLKKQIERAKKKIKSLTDDNETLKKLLQSEFEDNEGDEDDEGDKDDIDIEDALSSKSNSS